MDTLPLRRTAATITADASDLLLVELSIFAYIAGLSMINILRDITPVNDVLLIIAAADKFELVILSLLAVSTTSPPPPRSYEAPKTMTLAL